MSGEIQDYGVLQGMVDYCRKFPVDIFEGVVITDQQGVILYANEKHSAFYGRKPEEEIGNSIEALNSCSIFPRVITTGVPIVGKRLCVKGKEFVGSVVPIKKGNKVVGAIGISFCSNIESLKSLLAYSTTDLFTSRKSSSPNNDVSFEDMIGESRIFTEAKETAIQVAHLDFPILLLGESGTGKSMFARAIHNASPRRHFPFVRVNCAAIPKDLFEAELFGYAPGAFSGANPKGKPGKFEIANQGTIFLDEIGSLPMDQQIKLLDVLDEKELVRVGSVEPLQIDFRLITASNEDLERKVLSGSFRSDLYYRINVARLHLPALRQRKGDIPLLIRSKLNEIMERHHLEAETALEGDFISCLMSYSFPGNLRELFNLLEQTVIDMKVHKKNRVDPPFREDAAPAAKGLAPLRETLDRAEKEAIRQALQHCRGSVTEAAKILDINRTTLYKKIEKLKLNSLNT